MTKLKFYFGVIFLVVALIIEVGGVLPFLISAKDTLYVISGFATAIVSIPIYYVCITKLIKMAKQLNLSHKELSND